MKHIYAALVCMAALSSAQVLAQARSFEGFSLGATVDSDRSTISATGGSSDSGTSTGLGLQARYDWALGSNFLLGAGVTANTGTRKAGNYANGREASTKDRYSFDLVPSVAVSDKAQLFLKVSAVSGTAASSDGTSTASVNGTGYGLGFRGLINANAFWQIGYDSYKFNDVTFSNGTVSTYKGENLSLGIGFKF
jgi:hypothetical protein